MEQQTHPPIWVIALMALQVLLALWLLYIGMSFSGAQVRAGEILIYSAPLMLMLATSGLGWWLWLAGRRALAVVATTFVPVVLVFALVFVLGVGL